MVITLTPDEGIAAATIGCIHQIRAVIRNRKQDHGLNSSRNQRLRWADAIHGIMAEFAVAKALNRMWTPGGIRPCKGDIMSSIEVRATEHHDGHLIIHLMDVMKNVFVLATGHFPEFYIRGWIRGEELAYMENLWDDDKDPPCYWIPQSALHPIEDLVKLLNG